MSSVLQIKEFPHEKTPADWQDLWIEVGRGGGGASWSEERSPGAAELCEGDKKNKREQ